MIKNDFYKRPNGSVLMVLHKGGYYDLEKGDVIGGKVLTKKEITNLIVSSASKLMAMRMAPGETEGHLTASGSYIPGTTEGSRQGVGIRYLAVGTGALQNQDLPYDEVTNPSTWNLQDPPEETLDTTKLSGELFRKKFTDWKFLDEFGNLASEPTNILLLSTTFLEDEAVGPLVEMGLFGGGSVTDDPNSGIMFNYKTFKVINKENDCRISIIWKITF